MKTSWSTWEPLTMRSMTSALPWILLRKSMVRNWCCPKSSMDYSVCVLLRLMGSWMECIVGLRVFWHVNHLRLSACVSVGTVFSVTGQSLSNCWMAVFRSVNLMEFTSSWRTHYRERLSMCPNLTKQWTVNKQRTPFLRTLSKEHSRHWILNRICRRKMMKCRDLWGSCTFRTTGLWVFRGIQSTCRAIVSIWSTTWDWSIIASLTAEWSQSSTWYQVQQS